MEMFLPPMDLYERFLLREIRVCKGFFFFNGMSGINCEKIKFNPLDIDFLCLSKTLFT